MLPALSALALLSFPYRRSLDLSCSSTDSDTFTLKDAYVGEDFLHHWVWSEAVDDPTHGRIDYVLVAASSVDYYSASDNKFIKRADFENTVEDKARGRKSVRIFSIEKMRLRTAHRPLLARGRLTGVRNAGVNLDTQDLVTLHTTSDCKMSDDQDRRDSMNGKIEGLDCDANANGNEGCGVSMGKPATFGSVLNAAGGGYFVAVRTNEGGDAPKINVWFWSRYDPAVPDEVRDPSAHDTIAPKEQWGRPEAHFYLGDNCAYEDHFDAHQFAFGLTFCGDRAGNVYPGACPESCFDHVNTHPETFENAYWEINSFRVYTHQ
ncbi:hypothetical protein C8Q80DRAFT_1272741 [Daedaleopsis nitida]|nr:hypothetical protein C8Q80DRAFT_1272741 [Daedaleopsis nitida]